MVIDRLLRVGLISSFLVSGIIIVASLDIRPSVVTIEKITVLDRVVEVPVETIKTVEVPVHVYHEVVTERRINDDWTLPELEQFLSSDSVNEQTWEEEVRDCDDFASQLRDAALRVGKYLSVVVIDRTTYRRLFIVDLGTNPVNGLLYDFHVMNMAKTGNAFYYVEPQTDQIWLAYDLIDSEIK